jgi:hypothetical protein
MRQETSHLAEAISFICTVENFLAQNIAYWSSKRAINILCVRF